LIKTLKRNVTASVQWMDLYSRALAGTPDGLFAKEFKAWLYQQNEDMDGEPLVEGDRKMERDLDRSMWISINQMKRWKVLRLEMNPPDRVHPNTSLRLLDEPQVWLTKRGARLAAAAQWRRYAFVAPRVLWTTVKPYVLKLRGPAALASFALTLFKVSLEWSTIQSTVGAIGVGAAALTVSLWQSAQGD
jgi:hypothetical protein